MAFVGLVSDVQTPDPFTIRGESRVFEVLPLWRLQVENADRQMVVLWLVSFLDTTYDTPSAFWEVFLSRFSDGDPKADLRIDHERGRNFQLIWAIADQTSVVVGFHFSGAMLVSTIIAYYSLFVNV